MDAIKWPKIGAKLANVSSKNFSPFKLSPLLLQKEGHNLGEACDALAMFAGPMVRISLCVCVLRKCQVPKCRNGRRDASNVTKSNGVRCRREKVATKRKRAKKRKRDKEKSASSGRRQCIDFFHTNILE